MAPTVPEGKDHLHEHDDSERAESNLHTVRNEWSGFMPTTYSPIRRWGDIKGKKVGVVGHGGQGHMGVKLARAFGAHVVGFTTSRAKKADALRLGAHEVILSSDPEEMKAHAGSFDFILDTISADHDINAYINISSLKAE